MLSHLVMFDSLQPYGLLAHQAPLSMGFSRQEYWNRLPFPASGFDPWVRKSSWRREWQPTPVFLPGEFHGQRSLVGCSLWGHKELDTTEQLTHIHTDISIYLSIYIHTHIYTYIHNTHIL